MKFSLVNSEKIDFVVTTVTNSAKEDEYDTGLQKAYEKTPHPDETTPLNENKHLRGSIDNMLISEQLDDGMRSKMETTDEDFGFFGPFTSGNRSFRMRIYKIMAVTDPSILADFYAKARTMKNSKNSSNIAWLRATEHGNASKSHSEDYEYDYKNSSKLLDNEHNINNILSDNGKFGK